MNEHNAETGTGAIPTLDNAVLGAPGEVVRGKTNAKKAVLLLFVLIAFVLMIGGLIVFVKNRSANKVAPPVVEQKQNSILSRNVAVESDSIEKKKEELKLKDIAVAREKADQEAAAAVIAEQQRQASKGNQTGAAAPQGAYEATATNNRQATSNGNATGGRATGADGKPIPTLNESRRGGDVLVNTEVKGRSVTAQPAQANAQPNGLGFGAGQPQQSALANSLQPTVLASRSAGKLGNLDYLLKKGMSIPCVLDTGIDTTLPGFIVCRVTNDVYSANSKTLLVERGSTVFGEQQSSLKQGQERTFGLWSRIDTPNGVSINIDSPASDQQGYGGIPGYVDNHFFQRFGGAVLISFIKDFSASLNKNGQNQGFQNTQQGGSDIATETLRNSINIPPNLTVLPGTVVYVLVARDIDFSSIYTLVR